MAKKSEEFHGWQEIFSGNRDRASAPIWMRIQSDCAITCGVPRPKKRWELTPTGLEKLLQKIEESPALAQGGYPELHSRLVRFFEWQACQTPEEAADEAMDRATRKIEEGAQVTDLGGFIRGIAKNVLKEYQKSRQRHVSLEQIHGPKLQALPIVDQTLNRCVELCLERLPSQARSQFLEYLENKDREALASRSGSTLNALRIRISRLRDKLQNCTSECAAFGPTPAFPV